MNVTPVEQQLEALRVRHPGAEIVPAPGATGVVVVPNVKLPAGWNCATTTVRFVLPAGFPLAALDCFWVSPDLRLASGAVPQNAQVQNPPPQIPGVGPLLWFSWHVQSWNPGRDTMLTYMRVIQDRLKVLR